MKVISSQRTPLSRQVEEGHRISSFKGKKILNRSGEWGENLPPKLVVEDRKQDDGEAKSPQLRPLEKGKVKRNHFQGDQNPRASKRIREELWTTVQGEESENRQTPVAKIRTRSKIPNSLRDEVENQKVAAKSIPGTRADLA